MPISENNKLSSTSSPYRPHNILVTGSAGFIGSNFVHFMLSKYKDIHIVSLDKLTYAGNLNNLKNCPKNSQHTFIHGDICDEKLVANLLRTHKIETIVHFAAESHVDRSIANPFSFIQTNVNGTFVLLNEAKQFWLEENNWDAPQCRFHHISTDEVYGSLSPNDPPFSETTAYAPNSPYSASKAGSDHLVRAFFHTYGLPVTTSNCSNNYGPYQHPEKMIPTIIRSCLEERPIPVYGNGLNIRDWLYVEDHCHAIDKILSHGKIGEVYNIGGNNEVNNLTLVRTICELFDKLIPKPKKYDSLITFVKDRAGHDFRYAINMSKMKSELGWEPQFNFIHALQKTIEFYR